MQTLKAGESQQGHLILAVHASITDCRIPVSVLSWQSKKIKRVVRSSLAAEASSMSTCQEHLDWMRTTWEQMTRCEFVLENYEQFLKARPSILVTDCKSFYDAIRKECAAPASKDRRLAIELAIIKAKAVSGETDLRWIDARYQIADCLTKHASRKSEAVLQNILDEAQWRITAEDDMLDKRKQEREDRNNSSGGAEMPDVEVAYVVMDASHSQTDHVGRTRLANFCGSRDDSLSWNLSRVKQDGAIRADDMDHKTGAIVENTGLARRMRCTTFTRQAVRCIAGKKNFGVCESERASHTTTDVLTEPVNESASTSRCCA